MKRAYYFFAGVGMGICFVLYGLNFNQTEPTIIGALSILGGIGALFGDDKF